MEFPNLLQLWSKSMAQLISDHVHILTQRGQPLHATASPTHTQGSKVWPASTNGLQTSVTEACWLLAGNQHPEIHTPFACKIPEK